MSIKITPNDIANIITENCTTGIAEQLGANKIKMCSIAMACELSGESLSLGNAMKMSEGVGAGQQTNSGLHNAVTTNNKANGRGKV